MQVPEWRKVIGEMVRDHMRSPELEHYFSVKINKPRAQLMILDNTNQAFSRSP